MHLCLAKAEIGKFMNQEQRARQKIKHYKLGRSLYLAMARHKTHWGQRYMGVRCMKCVFDLWNYQEIMFQRNIQWILEMGSNSGGTAMYFADLMELRSATGHVVTVDIKDGIDDVVRKHKRIQFILGDSKSLSVV